MTARARLVVAVIAVALLAVSYLVAHQRPIPEPELEATRWFNSAPDAVALLLWPIMQAGQFLAPAVVALAMGLGWRRWPLAAGLLAAGWVSWLAAKAIKATVERERPTIYLPDVVVREGSGGFGFASGHAAVAAALAVGLAAVAPPWARPVVASVAAGAGMARIVYGVHLPADVTGGWGVGMIVAVVVLSALQRLDPASMADLDRGRL